MIKLRCSELPGRNGCANQARGGTADRASRSFGRGATGIGGKDETRFRAGFASVDITPADSLPMGGYIERAEAATGAHDPLSAKAAAFRIGKTAAIVLSLDILCVSREWAQKLREKISRKLGLARERVLIAATHTHSGPAVFFPAAGRTDTAAKYESLLSEKCAEAAERAYSEAESARLKAATGRCENAAGNRRDPTAPTDDLVSIVRVENPRGEVKGLLASFCCHPTVMGPSNLQYSADMFGVSAKIVERKYPGSTCIMFNGAAADMSTRFTRREQTWAELERLGKKLARAIIDIGKSAGEVAGGPIEAKTACTTFPFREIPDPERAQIEYDEAAISADSPTAAGGRDAEGRLARSLIEGAAARLLLSRIGGWQRIFGADRVEVELQAIRIGDVVVCGLPGEFFSVAGAILREAALPKLGFVAGYANGYCGYVVPPEEAEKGGYEAMMSPLAPECEPQIVNAAASLIREIKKSR